MLVGASYTLFRMRKNLVLGIRRSIADVKKSAAAAEATERTERDLSFKTVLLGIGVVFVLMVALYFYFTKVLPAAFFAAIVMLVTGFFFAAVSGNLVGMIGSSNNPISGLTLATTIIAALTMVIVGVKGAEGVAAVLGVAAVVCVSSAVAGEMLQDLKVGHILGGTPWKMQVGDLIGVVVSSLVLFFPLYLLHTSDVAANPGAGGFGGKNLAAPQAGLMAAISQGIVGGEMAWPLVIVGIALGLSLILVKVRSPMLFSVGMYLPLETTFAIFIGGLVRGLVDRLAAQARLQRGAEGTGGECGSPDGFRSHRRRGADGAWSRGCRGLEGLPSSLRRQRQGRVPAGRGLRRVQHPGSPSSRAPSCSSTWSSGLSARPGRPTSRLRRRPSCRPTRRGPRDSRAPVALPDTKSDLPPFGGVPSPRACDPPHRAPELRLDKTQLARRS